MYENIGENLKLLRQRRKPEYSQREIAEKLKVNRNTYAKYEQGKLMPPVWFLYEVARFYRIDFFDLVFGRIEGNEEE